MNQLKFVQIFATTQQKVNHLKAHRESHIITYRIARRLNILNFWRVSHLSRMLVRRSNAQSLFIYYVRYQYGYLTPFVRFTFVDKRPMQFNAINVSHFE